MTPIIGETVNNVNINGTVDNSATGNNVTFTNTSLTAGSASSATYSAPSSTEISTFPGSTINYTLLPDAQKLKSICKAIS
ncbi:hypothetical protein LPB85_20530, partial [Chryseobacterium sp. LC2016-27]|nr:hypothetical protein [Chryseobacterium sp. LC2016-27]